MFTMQPIARGSRDADLHHHFVNSQLTTVRRKRFFVQRTFVNRALLVLSAGLIAFGTASPQTNSLANSPSTRKAEYTDGGLSFTYPANWHAAKYDLRGSFGRVIVYLSSQSIHDPCVRSVGTISCGSPIGRLSPGSVLLAWSSIGGPTLHLADVPGQGITISGRQARLQVERPGICGQIGGDETVTGTIEGGSSNFYQLVACLRSPGDDGSRRAIEDLFSSVVIR